MGVFDRLGNLGKGMVGIMKQGSASGEERMAALEAELAAMRRKGGLTPTQKREVDAGDKRLKQLKSLHASGLLSDEEYAQKLAALTGGTPAAAAPEPRESDDFLRRRPDLDEEPAPADGDAPAPSDDDDLHPNDPPRIKKTL